MAGAVRRRKQTKPSRQGSAVSTSSSHQHPGSTAGGGGRHPKNISLCLARGATARNLHPTLLQPLAQEEMEKDLRHMQAYAAAVKSYQQQYYIQANRMAATETEGGRTTGASVVPLVSLPVRIDPEEEKRLINLRKKIARAEVIREEAEQHYVASRAHYVHTVQDLEKTSQERFHIMEFLQKLVASRAHVVACQRARLQMARDIKDCLQARIDALQQYEDERRQAEGVPPAPYTPHLTGDDPLSALWNQVEDEYKKAVASCFEKRKKPLAWPGTHLPSTPEGIPALLSAASIVPDKSCAFSAKGMFGCKDSSMVWLEGHLPLETEEEKEGEYADVERLEKQVERLEAELDKERRNNQEMCQKIGVTRQRNDEWVAMMCILRQETEAVLHRHNTILQSEQAMAAAQRLSEEEERTATVTVAADTAKPTISTEPTTTEEIAMPTKAAVKPVDEANYGDDEGSNNIEEDEEEWNNKRPAGEIQDGSPKGGKRQRRA